MLTVIPAYGRDYKTAREVKLAWHAGQDFIIADYFHPSDGKYIGKESADREGITVAARFNSLRASTIIAPYSAPPSDTPRPKGTPAPICGERFCTRKTRAKSGYCTRHNTPIWQRIREKRAREGR